MAPQPTTYGSAPAALLWPTVYRAKALMRAGKSLNETAAIIGVRPSDLDWALWRHLGEGLR